MPLYPFVMAYAITRQGFLEPEEVLALHRDKLALMGLMSSSINHEIKNPLFLLQEYANKLLPHVRERMIQEDDVETMTKMSAQISRMTKLVHRLSEFGRPNPKVDTLEEIDAKQAFDDALFFASQELKYQNIEVKFNLPESLPKIHGNKNQFEEIFLNLILNAFQAMPKGGVLTIAGRHVKGQIEITIQDTGMGIPKHQIKNIFKPFYTTKQKTGTGLGLYIVKTLVEQNGGKIEVESKLGRGTLFRLSFILK